MFVLAFLFSPECAGPPCPGGLDDVEDSDGPGDIRGPGNLKGTASPEVAAEPERCDGLGAFNTVNEEKPSAKTVMDFLCRLHRWSILFLSRRRCFFATVLGESVANVARVFDASLTMTLESQ